jgi:hypothetical protein
MPGGPPRAVAQSRQNRLTHPGGQLVGGLVHLNGPAPRIRQVLLVPQAAHGLVGASAPAAALVLLAGAHRVDAALDPLAAGGVALQLQAEIGRTQEGERFRGADGRGSGGVAG